MYSDSTSCFYRSGNQCDGTLLMGW